MCLYLKIAGMLWLVCGPSLHKTMVPIGGGYSIGLHWRMLKGFGWVVVMVYWAEF